MSIPDGNNDWLKDLQAFKNIWASSGEVEGYGGLLATILSKLSLVRKSHQHMGELSRASYLWGQLHQLVHSPSKVTHRLIDD